MKQFMSIDGFERGSQSAANSFSSPSPYRDRLWAFHGEQLKMFSLIWEWKTTLQKGFITSHWDAVVRTILIEEKKTGSEEFEGVGGLGAPTN